MKRMPVVSREYKVMLLPAKFRGHEPALLEAAAQFWQDFSRTIAETALDATGALDRIKKRRLIQFFDTDGGELNEAGYIFRVRRDVNGGRAEATLKFRHEDRYVSESRRVKTRQTGAEVKFEEDIKAPFVSLYSCSASIALGTSETPADRDGLVKIFPGLNRRLTEEHGLQTLSPVGHFTARELVITGAQFRIGRNTGVEAECALIVWYDEMGKNDQPVAAEFSFRYGDEAEGYGGGAARRAFASFHALQAMEEWIDTDPRTKTRFVMEKALTPVAAL
ncbi:MAG TPA: hypothetical protein VGF24_26245 [Vicinamibacterales bacterium]|jgi:hypothetical protein